MKANSYPVSPSKFAKSPLAWAAPFFSEQKNKNET